ncbi:EAL domain-containing response regulator [Frateuria terrea]|uniref:PAS domain S-box-containing protein/diguanylate cyclase (GGDEF) domain-containing protein n=1 Tax=Frateuria terrea TaxID=529704 RepID=A0A1H6QSM0_9GAMM|nr:GGDEF domain-containing phosphodiesterase [Frateuria terrea]SEI42255.1 PAS domain S-box-containing protein/diguanylate cyclase (GGDEF) domain-containing protein [Frateuria terrea]SFP07556.1 PAS domain S-box-containing protein/diguanylate cyclase (GGDEF) domain-containing protein [Frateuria terrea]
MKKDSVIKILFVEKSVEDAEQIISLLRNAGIAVRPARATQADQMQAALDELEPDVVLFDPAAGLELREVVHLLDAHGRDVALVALVNQLDTQSVAEMFVGGVRGTALRTQPKQLIAVLQREFDALHTRRQVRLLEAALRESERRCDALLDSSTDAIAYVHEGMHVRANRAYLETFGYDDFEDLLGLPVLDMIGTADAETFKNLLRAHSRKEKAPSQQELQARRADGGTFKATVEFASATFEGEPCLQIVFRRQQVDQALIEQLQRDPVTGLLNRARTLEYIDEAVAAAAKGKKGQTLLLIEPDNWQTIVAGIGLGQADELLAAFAGRVSALLGETDMAGLLAEHTIGVMLDTRSDEGIKQWINGLLQAVASEIFDAGTRSITVAASIGGSLLGEKNANAELLLNQASQALRNAQSQGGGRMELHDPAAREKAEEERERYWLQLLKQALEQNNFVLYHQHTVSLQDAEGEYSEVLLRMNGPQGEVLPGFFMPIAEKHQLTPAIDRWVINRAIEVLKARDGQGIQTTFFVKLTADSMQDAAFLPWLEDRLKRAALRQGQLVLEMTESKVVTLLRPAQEFIQRWKKMGGRFALEQFGSGLNSFQLLAHIDADYLKIDRTYMNQLPQHPENQKKIGEICAQAHEMKRLTVAEWVEDATSTSLLFACGVDFVQGNFLQEPQRLL